jgi:uncharacterized membrane protein YqjE
MDKPEETSLPLTGASRKVARRFFVILENRLQLLMVEAQEERERVLLFIWLGLGIVIFALLAGVALTVVVAVAFWNHSPVIALLVLTAIYGAIAGFLYTRLLRLQRDWQTLPETLDQLRKDRECLEKNFT